MREEERENEGVRRIRIGWGLEGKNEGGGCYKVKDCFLLIIWALIFS